MWACLGISRRQAEFVRSKAPWEGLHDRFAARLHGWPAWSAFTACNPWICCSKPPTLLTFQPLSPAAHPSSTPTSLLSAQTFPWRPPVATCPLPSARSRSSTCPRRCCQTSSAASTQSPHPCSATPSPLRWQGVTSWLARRCVQVWGEYAARGAPSSVRRGACESVAHMPGSGGVIARHRAIGWLGGTHFESPGKLVSLWLACLELTEQHVGRAMGWHQATHWVQSLWLSLLKRTQQYVSEQGIGMGVLHQVPAHMA